MSLKGRAVRGKSFAHPLQKADLASPLSDTEKGEAIEACDWDRLIEAHMRLGCSIAGRYHAKGGDADEMVSAAMLGICDAVSRFSTGLIETDNLTGYIVAYIHQHCSETARRDCVIPPPQHNKPAPTQELFDTVTKDFNIVDFDDRLAAIIQTDREALIISLRRQGYTDGAISGKMGIPRSTVTMVRLNLLKRFQKG